MKTTGKASLMLVMITASMAGFAQTFAFDELNANSGSNKEIEWATSGYGNGYGHKIYNHDPGGKTLLNIAGRNNSTSWTDILTITSNGKVGIGTTDPATQFHVNDEQVLGANTNNSQLLFRVSARTSNMFMRNLWLRRDASGTNWFTARLHDGISVDASYLTPGTNTKTWWERDPYNNIQSWGTSSETYMTLRSGKLGIGTETTGSHRLAVEGSIGAREVKVEATGWSDFVFEPGYSLPTLQEVEQHIAEKGHLPEIPSEVEVTENGINLGEMNAKLLQKIEELTLYLIEEHKQNQQLKEQVTTLTKKVESLATNNP